jgi:hypothetical protein
VSNSTEISAPNAQEQAKRRRGRSIAIALALGGMALLFYAATIVHLGGNVLNRPM